MPFEAGAFELIFLSIVALIFVGPKDLPILLRKVGQFTAKMRGLAAEFRSSFDEMARQSELDELRKEVEALRTGQFAAAALPDVESHVSEINAHLSSTPSRLGTPPLPTLSQAEEPRFTDDMDAEPLLPFDGPSGEEAYREEPPSGERRRSRDTVEDGSAAPFDGPAGEEAYREGDPGRDRRRSRDTVEDGSAAPFDGPAGEEAYREGDPGRDRRRSRDTVDDGSAAPFDGPAGDEGYAEETRRASAAPA